MASIYDWSVTPGDNATADANINWQEGQSPSTVNNSSRQEMGRIAEFIADIGGTITAGGTANALTVTANSAFTTYADGRMVAFKAASDNTGAATLSVNAIGAKAIRKMNLSGDAALTGGEIQEDGVYIVQYSTDADSAAGGWLLVNPTRPDPTIFGNVASASGSVTFTFPENTVEIIISVGTISFDSTDNLIVRLGDSGGFETTGYDSVHTTITGSLNTNTTTAGFLVPGTGGSAGTSMSAKIHLTLINDSSNFWQCTATANQSGSAAMGLQSGTKSLSGPFTQVQLKGTASGNLDAGNINVIYRTAVT